MISCGQHASRLTFLAYAFLREIPYATLERKINEDHPTFDSGVRNAFFRYLSWNIAVDIAEVSFGKPPMRCWDMNDEDKSKRMKYDILFSSLRDDVYAWILEKYKIPKI